MSKRVLKNVDLLGNQSQHKIQTNDEKKSKIIKRPFSTSFKKEKKDETEIEPKKQNTIVDIIHGIDKEKTKQDLKKSNKNPFLYEKVNMNSENEEPESDILEVYKEFDLHLMPEWFQQSFDIIDAEVDKAPNILMMTALLYQSFCFVADNRIAGKSLVLKSPRPQYANAHFIAFISAGIGKDHSLIAANELFAKYNKSKFERQIKLEDIRKQQVINYLQSIQMDSSQKINREDIDQLRPSMTTTITDGTAEGFVDNIKNAMLMGYGHTNVIISEFGDYITKENYNRDLIEKIKVMYDSTSKINKSTKKDKFAKPVGNVPVNFWAHTSPANLLSGKNREKLETFFSRGNVRRNFIIFPPRSDIKQSKIIGLTPTELMDMLNEQTKKIEEKQPFIQDFFNDVGNIFFDRLSKDIEHMNPIDIQFDGVYGGIYETTKKASMVLSMIKQWVDSLFYDSYLSSDESELENQMIFLKVFKTSTMLASITHPNDLVITSVDVLRSFMITYHLMDQFDNYMTNKNNGHVSTTFSNPLYKLLLKHVGKTIRLNHLREKKILMPDGKPFKNYSNYPQLKIDVAEQLAKIIEFQKVDDTYGLDIEYKEDKNGNKFISSFRLTLNEDEDISL